MMSVFGHRDIDQKIVILLSSNNMATADWLTELLQYRDAVLYPFGSAFDKHDVLTTINLLSYALSRCCS